MLSENVALSPLDIDRQKLVRANDTPSKSYTRHGEILLKMSQLKRVNRPQFAKQGFSTTIMLPKLWGEGVAVADALRVSNAAAVKHP